MDDASPDRPPEDLEDRLERVVGEVLARREQGEVVEPARVLAEHEDLADALAPRLAVMGLLDGLARDPAGARSAALRVELGPDRRVGPYRILARLGSGGMGTVYRAEREPGGRDATSPVALKVLHPELLRDPTIERRFRREAAIGRRILHPGVVRTLDAGTATVDGREIHYLVMEHAEGRTLREVIAAGEGAAEAYAREIARQLADGLAAVHEAGLVHRDLKPENVMIAKDGRVRLMDLGLARLVDASIRLTSTGQFAGSLLYAAPEQLRDGRLTNAVDLFALGVLLFELMTGSRPYRTTDLVRAVEEDLHLEPPRPADRGGAAGPFFDEVVRTLLSTDPGQRFESAAALGRVLEAGEASGWWSARHERAPSLPLRAALPVDRRVRLVGRETERARLLDVWRRARSGDGGTVLLSGPRGMGKTRLAAEVLEAAAPDASAYVGLAPGAGPAALVEGLRQGLAPDARAGPEAVAPGSVVPTLAAHLGDLARRRSVLVILDDLDRAAPETRAIAFGLAASAANRRAMVVLTWTERPTGLRAHELRPAATALDLQRLSADAMERLLRQAFAADVASSPFDADVLAKADGVPGFLLALLEGLEQDGALARDSDGRLRVRVPDARLRLPTTLRDLAAMRLSRLRTPAASERAGRDPLDERSLLELAATAGLVFDAHALARAVDRPPIAVLKALSEIERRTGIVRSAGRAYRFDNPILRDALLETLDEARREELRGRRDA